MQGIHLSLQFQRLDASGLIALDRDTPIIIGWGNTATIQLTEPANKPAAETGVYAYIGEADDMPFVQAAEDRTTLKHNGMPLLESAWLKHGDVLQLDSLLQAEHIICHLQDQVLTLEVKSESDLSTQQTASTTAPLAPPPAQPSPFTAPPPSSKKALSPSNTRKHILVGLFGLLIAAAAFVLIATSVELNIEPSPDWSDIEGFPPVIEVGDKYLAIPGRYSLHARKAGYEDLQKDILIEYRPNQAFNETLMLKTGHLNILSHPVLGAKVFIDDQLIGITPIDDYKLKAGTYSVLIKADNTLPATQSIDIVGKGQHQSIDLELLPSLADIHIESNPAGANILNHNGEQLGQTPITLALAQGRHELSLQLAKFKSSDLSIDVEAQKNQDIATIELEPADGVVEINSTPEGVSVMVDQRYRGRTPLTLTLSPNTEHQIQLNKAGYTSRTQRLTLEPEASEHLSLKLSPQYGTVFLTSSPDDAQLMVDGKAKGNATQRLRLTTRNHKIIVKKAGYKDYHATLRPRSASAQSIDIQLLKIGQTAPQTSPKQPKVVKTAGGQTLKVFLAKGAPIEFEMGASRREPGRRANEVQHKVSLKRAFYLSTHEVTNEQYRQFKVSHNSGDIQGHSLDQNKQPVVNISWDDTARYLNWLSKKDGLKAAYKEVDQKMQVIQPLSNGYRLPTEAEWAYAARIAGTSQPVPSKYPWGSTFPPTQADYNLGDSNAIAILPSIVAGYNDGFGVSAPVGSFIPDLSGLYDLSGNVAEWCLDYYAIKAGSKGDVDPIGPTKGKHHVVRGSSWRDASITELRWTFRDYSKSARNDLGFRIARYR